MAYPEWTPDQQFSRMAESGVGGAVSLNEDSSEDKKLSVRFFLEPIKNDQKSKEAGRPIFDEVEMCEIIIPPGPDKIRNIVTDKERYRFAQRYEAFKKGQNQDAASGTPLSEWPQMTRSQVEELRYFGIRTVEHVAGLSDGNLKQLGAGWMETRAKASDFLKKAAGDAPMVKLREENADLRRRLETLEGMVQRQSQSLAEAREGAPPPAATAGPDPLVVKLMERVAALTTAMKPAEPPKRRGRPPKAPAPEV